MGGALQASQRIAIGIRQTHGSSDLDSFVGLHACPDNNILVWPARLQSVGVSLLEPRPIHSPHRPQACFVGRKCRPESAKFQPMLAQTLAISADLGQILENIGLHPQNICARRCGVTIDQCRALTPHRSKKPPDLVEPVPSWSKRAEMCLTPPQCWGGAAKFRCGRPALKPCRHRVGQLAARHDRRCWS